MSNEKHQYELAQAVKNLRDNMPAFIELAQLQAAQMRAKYIALVNAGFDAAQALELCKT